MAQGPGDGKKEVYVSVDIEAAGPIPGEYSMLSLGACLVDDLEQSFYVEFQPINDACVQEAIEVSGLALDSLKLSGKRPQSAMSAFRDWIVQVSGNKTPVMVGFNGSFDWSFVNWYFHRFIGTNPLGHGAVDIKSYYMGLSGSSWSSSSSRSLPVQFQPEHRQTHNALDDAVAQAEIFEKLLASSRARSSPPTD